MAGPNEKRRKEVEEALDRARRMRAEAEVLNDQAAELIRKTAPKASAFFTREQIAERVELTRQGLHRLLTRPRLDH